TKSRTRAPTRARNCPRYDSSHPTVFATDHTVRDRPIGFRTVTLTAQEYEALPADNRMELVDGIVRMGPTPTRRHQTVAENLRAALKVVCPDDLRIVGVQEVRIGELHRRNPDLMAIQAVADDLDVASFDPAEVALAIEVVSPGTETT